MARDLPGVVRTETQVVDTHPPKLLKRSVVVLSIFALCIDSLAVRSVILLAPFIRSALRLTDDQVGYVMAAMVAGTLVITIPAGSFLGRLDARLAFSSMMFAVGLAFFGLSFQQSFWGLLITLFILGVFRAGIIPQVTRFITEHFSQDQRGRIIGLSYAAVPLGGFLGAVVLPTLAELVDWNTSYRFLGLVALLGSLLIWKLAPSGGGSRRVISRNAGFASLLTLPFIILSAAYGLFALSMAGEVFVTLYLVDVGGISAALAGTFFGLIQLTGTGGRVFWGFLADHTFRSNRWTLLAITSGLAVVSYALLICLKPGTPWWGITGIMIFLGMSVASSWVILSTLVGDVVGVQSVALGVAAIFFLTNITDISGSILYGNLLKQTHSYQVTLSLFAGMAAIACLIFTVMALRSALHRAPKSAPIIARSE